VQFISTLVPLIYLNTADHFCVITNNALYLYSADTQFESGLGYLLS